MKIFSHVAMLLAFFAGNMAMWGQISRTVSFDLIADMKAISVWVPIQMNLL